MRLQKQKKRATPEAREDGAAHARRWRPHCVAESGVSFSLQPTAAKRSTLCRIRQVEKVGAGGVFGFVLTERKEFVAVWQVKRRSGKK